MTIDPFLQFQHLLAAFFCGLVLGLLADAVKHLLVLLGVSPPPQTLTALLARPLPLIKRSVWHVRGNTPQDATGLPRHTARSKSVARAKEAAYTVSAAHTSPISCAQQAVHAPHTPYVAPPRASQAFRAPSHARRTVQTVLAAGHRLARVLFLGGAQFFFPVLAAILLLLVSFYYNRGGFRLASVPMLLFGLFLWRGKFSHRLARPLSLVTFLLAATGLYLRLLLALPFKAALWLLWRFCLLPLKHVFWKIRCFHRQKRSSALCTRQLAAAKNGFLEPRSRVKVKEKRKNMSKKKKKGRGSATVLTLVIRALIVLIFAVALIIAFNRVGEVMQNNQKKEEMQQAQTENASAVFGVFL